MKVKSLKKVHLPTPPPPALPCLLYLCLGLCRASIPEEEGVEEPKFSRILREIPGFIQQLFTSPSVQEKRVGKIKRARSLDDSKYKRVLRFGAVDDDNYKRVLRAGDEDDYKYKRVLRAGDEDDYQYKRVLRSGDEEDSQYKRVQNDVNYGR